MLKQLAVALLVVTLALADDTTQPPPQEAPAEEAPAQPQITEEQANEAVFEVSQELAQEVKDAVRTINDVFGNPGCAEDQQPQNKRFSYYAGGWPGKRNAVEKRGWGKKLLKTVAKAAVTAYVLGKREAQDSVEKRGWGSKLLKGAAILAIAGKREAQHSQEKRGWGSKLFRKIIPKVPVHPGIPIGTVVGKREEQESLEKRGWGSKLAKIAAAGVLLGKRDGEASDSSAPAEDDSAPAEDDSAPAVDAPAPAEDAPAPSEDAPAAAEEEASPSNEDEEAISPEEEVQFEADVGRLREAVEILNQVLFVAESSLDNSS